MKLHVALKNMMGFLLGRVCLLFNSECHGLRNLAFSQWSFNLHYSVNIKKIISQYRVMNWKQQSVYLRKVLFLYRQKMELVALFSVCTYELYMCCQTQLKAHKKVMLFITFESFTTICHVNEWRQKLCFLLQWLKSGAPSTKLAELHSCEATSTV